MFLVNRFKLSLISTRERDVRSCADEKELVVRGVDVQLEFLINASINGIPDFARLLYAAF